MDGRVSHKETEKPTELNSTRFLNLLFVLLSQSIQSDYLSVSLLSPSQLACCVVYIVNFDAWEGNLVKLQSSIRVCGFGSGDENPKEIYSSYMVLFYTKLCDWVALWDFKVRSYKIVGELGVW